MSMGLDFVLDWLVGKDLSGQHRQRVIDKQFQKYIARKKLSTDPEDIAIALQGEALLRSYSLSSASRPTTPFLSPNLTRVNTLETSPSSPPSTPQHVATKPSVPLKKSQIPEVAHPVKRHQGATSTLFETRLRDAKADSKLEHDGNTFKNTIWESFQADKEEGKTQSTPNTSHGVKMIDEPNPKYPWPPKMAGGAGRYRYAVDASPSWIQENTVSQMENTCIAGALWHLGTRLNLSFPDGTRIASVAESKLARAYCGPPKELSHEVDEDGVHIFKGFNGSGKALKPIMRTKNEVSVQLSESVHDSPAMTNKVSFSHSGKLVDPFGGPSQASYKAPTLCNDTHPLSQSYRAAVKTQRILAPRQQMPISYTGSENAFESYSDNEWLGEVEESGIDTTKINPTKIQPTFTIGKKLVPSANFVRSVSLIHEQLQMRCSNSETVFRNNTENESSEKGFEGATKMAEVPAETQKETVKTSVRERVAVKSQAKPATGSKVAPKAKGTRKGPIKKAVRFSKQLVTKINNEVSVVAAKDLDDHTGSANTIASSSRSDSSVEMQLQAQHSKSGKQHRKDSTDPSSVSSGEHLPQQKKLSTKAKGKQRVVESDGNISDSSNATVVYKPTKVGRKRAVTAIRIPKVEVAVENI